MHKVDVITLCVQTLYYLEEAIILTAMWSSIDRSYMIDSGDVMDRDCDVTPL